MTSTSSGGFSMAVRVAVVVIAAAVATCSSASARELHPMIVGGQPAPVGSFGMMAFVAYFVGTTPEFVCSGTVVSSNVVLTAGHCGEDTTTGIAYQAAGYRIVTSSLDWTSTATRQISNVSQVIVYPGYSPATGDRDAAMLVLSTPTTAPAIALASDPGDVTLLEPGTGGEIAGWGATAAAPLTAQLQWGQDVVQDPAYCLQQAGQLGGAFNSGDQVCAIDAPTDADGACNGDSGGPLVVQRADSTWVEVGVISRGPTDCSTGEPDFFTRARCDLLVGSQLDLDREATTRSPACSRAKLAFANPTSAAGGWHLPRSDEPAPERLASCRQLGGRADRPQVRVSTHMHAAPGTVLRDRSDRGEPPALEPLQGQRARLRPDLL